MRTGASARVGAALLVVLSAAADTPPDQSWLAWQLVDSAFPTGGFAHSGGLEAAWQQGEIRSGTDAAAFIQYGLKQIGRGSLPFVLAAFQDPARLIELEEWYDSFTSNHVANRASRLQGRAFWNGVLNTFLSRDQEVLSSMPAHPLLYHLPPLFGALAKRLALEKKAAARMFLFLHLRGWISSAIRLGVTGPMEGQRIQRGLSAEAEGILSRCLDLPLEDAAQVAPLIELWQGCQDRLYSRLFQS